MLLMRKKSDKTKGHLAYNGKRTHDWISKEDKSSPTVHTESLMVTCAVDVHQRRDVMCDVAGHPQRVYSDKRTQKGKRGKDYNED